MSAKTSKTAIIVPVYNRPTTVLKALNSVLAQTLRPNQLLIIDDGSTDETAARIKDWMRSVKASLHIRLLRAAHAGAAAARNKGLARLKDYDFVSFLDSDDILPADFLTRTVAVLTARERTIAVSVPRRIYANGAVVFDDMKQFALDPLLWMFEQGAGIASSSLFRCAAIKALGGFDERIWSGHDMALFAPLSQQGEWQIIEGAAVSIYRNLSASDEAMNLSEDYANRFLDWALVREAVFNNLLSDKERQQRVYSYILSYLWHQAGFKATQAGQMKDAQHYYMRALTWNRLHWQSYVRLMMLWMGSLLMRKKLRSV